LGDIGGGIAAAAQKKSISRDEYDRSESAADR